MEAESVYPGVLFVHLHTVPHRSACGGAQHYVVVHISCCDGRVAPKARYALYRRPSGVSVVILAKHTVPGVAYAVGFPDVPTPVVEPQLPCGRHIDVVAARYLKINASVAMLCVKCSHKGYDSY